GSTCGRSTCRRSQMSAVVHGVCTMPPGVPAPNPDSPLFQLDASKSILNQSLGGASVVYCQFAGSVCAVRRIFFTCAGGGRGAQSPVLVLSRAVHFFQIVSSESILINTPPITGRACMPASLPVVV